MSINFKVGDVVVYPTHGVGTITGEEVSTVAGHELQLYIISFNSEKMLLRVPKAKAKGAGLRHLSSENQFDMALEILSSKGKLPKGMWSKRAQEYEKKINSGDVLAIAEVLRELYRSDTEDRSYSERVIYDCAIERLANEYSIAKQVTKESAKEEISTILEIGYNVINER